MKSQDIVPMCDLDFRKMPSLCDRNPRAPGMLQAAGSNKDVTNASAVDPVVL
jgi:hypothetical protein